MQIAQHSTELFKDKDLLFKVVKYSELYFNGIFVGRINGDFRFKIKENTSFIWSSKWK